jgi:predicted PurR-regulated permease PerM
LAQGTFKGSDMENKILKQPSSKAVVVAAYLIIIAIVKYSASIVTPILLALFITIVCAQPIKWLKGKRVPGGMAIFIVLILVLGILFGFGEVIGRSVIQFSEDSSVYAHRLNDIMSSLFDTLRGLGMNVSLEKLEQSISPNSIMNASASFLGALGGLMSNTFLITFIIIFMLLEINSFNIKVTAITNISGGSMSYIKRIDQSIRHYLGLMTIISFITGLLIYISLMLIGVEYAILWALIAFIFNFIPNIGSILASFPAILFAMIQLGLGGALWTMGAYAAINMIIGNVVQPPIMGKGMGLSTLVVFISLIFWGYVLGTVGMFLSVPLTMVVKNVLEQKESTRWFSIILGTEKAAKEVMEQTASKLKTPI